MANTTIIKKMWGIGDTSNIPLFLPYGISGFIISIDADEINPSAGVYNWESVLGTQLDDIVSNGLQGGILLIAGASTPAYKMAQVGTFNTTGGSYDGPYPYYFNPTYISWYYDLFSRLFDFIHSCSAPRKACLQFVQITEGYTGDPGPYKGDPTNYNWNGQTSIDTSFGSEWDQYRYAAWAQFNIYNAQNALFCTLLVNPGNDNQSTDYVQDNYPDFFLKNGIVSHQIVFDGEVQTLIRVGIDRGEMQQFFDDVNWQIAPLQMNWTIFCSFIALQLDIPNSPTGFIVRGGGDNNDLWDFGNRYLGLTTADNIGMIALRDAADFGDTTRFDEGTYGVLIDPTRTTQYNTRVAQATAAFSSAPTYLAFQLNNLIVIFLNPARQAAIEAYMAAFGANYDPGNPYLNDMGTGMLLNYECFLTQYDPNNTSRGWYRLGPIDTSNLYGRFSRSTDHANGKDEMFFIIDAAIITEAGYSVTLRITYYDAGAYQWSLNYRDEYGPAVAFTNTNGGTNTWLQRTETIPNLQGKAYDNSTDFSIKYEAAGDTPVALIEFYDVEESVIPADEPPTVIIISPDSPVTIYQPDNSVDVVASVTPAYLHSIISILWEYISGPATYTISSPATANTTLGDLIAGSYTFRITGTQDDAQTASAEIIINVVATQAGTKYIIHFLNKQTVDGGPAPDIYRVELKPKNYSGIDREIEGTDKPFELKYQSGDGDIYSPIKASEATVQFWTNGNISINDFYNDDDTFWQVLFYGEKIFNQDAADVLLWIGFLQLDNSGEDLQDRPHVISLNANDNLGLLKNVALPKPTTTQIYEGILLTELFASILQQTTLSLECKAYLNIFENNTEDRSVVDTNDFLQQTVVYTNNLQNSDGTYKDCFVILNELLNTFRVQLFQALGTWALVRQGEYRLFTDAAVPGTLYNAAFDVQEAITLDHTVTIGRDLNILPINENQIKRILRPYQFVKKTFTYNQPRTLIIQADLALPTGAIPFDTHTDGTTQFDDYSIATYFPDWSIHPGDTSYLEVVTDTDTGNEISRYMVTPGSPGIYGGITFNNIPVSLTDEFDLSFQFRTFADTGDPVRFYCNFLLCDTSGMYWYILGFHAFQDSSTDLQWIGPVSTLPVPFIQGPETAIDDSIDNSQWTPYTLSELPVANGKSLAIPADGILLVSMLASNGPDDNTHPDLLWNNINITFKNAVNTQTIITAQVHTQTQDINAKNNSDLELSFDDSPLSTISGTLIRVPLASFASPVNDLYFFRTNRWHRAQLSESLRLNQIQTFDQLFIQRKTRTIVEGDFFGLRYQKDDTWQYLSVQNILKINFLLTLNFIFGIVSFDYMAAQWNATLYECFDDGEEDSDLENVYDFKYLYKNT